MPWSQTLLPLQSCHASLSHRLFDEWLQARGLADKVADDPPTIQLRFEHKATDQLTGSDDFYTHSKENRYALLMLMWLTPACSRLTCKLAWTCADDIFKLQIEIRGLVHLSQHLHWSVWHSRLPL